MSTAIYATPRGFGEFLRDAVARARELAALLRDPDSAYERSMRAQGRTPQPTQWAPAPSPSPAPVQADPDARRREALAELAASGMPLRFSTLNEIDQHNPAAGAQMRGALDRLLADDDGLPVPPLPAGVAAEVYERMRSAIDVERRRLAMETLRSRADDLIRSAVRAALNDAARSIEPGRRNVGLARAIALAPSADGESPLPLACREAAERAARSAVDGGRVSAGEAQAVADAAAERAVAQQRSAHAERPDRHALDRQTGVRRVYADGLLRAEIVLDGEAEAASSRLDATMRGHIRQMLLRRSEGLQEASAAASPAEPDVRRLMVERTAAAADALSRRPERSDDLRRLAATLDAAAGAFTGETERRRELALTATAARFEAALREARAAGLQSALDAAARAAQNAGGFIAADDPAAAALSRHAPALETLRSGMRPDHAAALRESLDLAGLSRRDTDRDRSP